MAGRRKTFPPRRLGYSGLGQQEERVLQTSSRQGPALSKSEMEAPQPAPEDKFKYLTAGNLQVLIDGCHESMRYHHEQIQRLEPILQQFQKRDPVSLTDQDKEDYARMGKNWEGAVSVYNEQYDLAQEYQAAMMAKAAQTPNPQQQVIPDQVESVMKAGGRKKGSSVSSSSSAKKEKDRAKIDYKQKLQKVRHKFEEDVDDISHQIIMKKLELETADVSRKEEIQKMITQLENQSAKIHRDFDRKKKHLEEELALEEEKIDVENEDIFSSDEEQVSDKNTSGWASSLYQQLFQSGAVQDQKEKSVHGGAADNFQDCDDSLPPAPTSTLHTQRQLIPHSSNSNQPPPTFYPPPPPLYGPSQRAPPFMHQQPPMLNRPPPPPPPRRSGHPPFYGYAGGPPPPVVDTNTVMVQLMQTQLKVMEKSMVSYQEKQLPEFSGDPADWGNFKSTFDRTTQEYGYQNGRNLARLQTALKGKAKEAVNHLMNNVDNVPEIMKTLERRFGRPEYVLDHLIENVKKNKSPDLRNPSTLVDFGLSVTALVANINAYNRADYLYNRSLVLELISKMPGPLRGSWFEWLEKDSRRGTNLLHFSEWLERKVRAAERQLIPSLTSTTATKSEEKSKPKRGSAVNTAVSDGDSEKTEKSKCAYCDKTNHPIWKCFFFKKLDQEARSKTAKEKGLCFRCLEDGHMKKDCKSNITCGVEDCKMYHHTLLHSVKPVKNQNTSSSKTKKNDGGDAADKKNGESSKSADGDSTVIGSVQVKSSKPLSIVKVRVKGPKGIRKTYALLDSGANISAISAKLAAELGICGEAFIHQCTGIGGNIIKEKAQRVEFQVAGSYRGAKFYDLKDVVTMGKLGLAPYTQNPAEAKKKWPFMKAARLEAFTEVVPEIVIGEDHPHVTAHRQILERGVEEPMAKRTILGWVLAGKKVGENSVSSLHACSECNTDQLEKLMKQHFSLEAYGVNPQESRGSVEDKKALDILERTSKKKEDRWECGLLWRNAEAKLPESRNEAFFRLLSNERRMKKDPVLYQMYHDKIHEYIQKGYITELTREQADIRTDKTFYLPHFGVYSVNKPGKLRLVFDAAAAVDGKCLNDFLLTGPDLIRPLTAVLWNFRRHNIVINGDITDMFHRVDVIEEDRNSQRFLWRDLKEGSEVKTYVMNVLIFGACSSPSSAIYIKNRNAQQFTAEYPEAARAIQEDFYCDDCLSGATSEEEAIKLKQEIMKINAAGNFQVRKWLSNSKKVLESIPEEDRADGAKKFGMKTDVTAERVLGLWWNLEEDIFTFTTNFKKVDPTLLEGRRPTKREVARLIMSIFDPLGLFANFKIKGCMLLQQIWRSGIDWDEQVTEPVYTEWKTRVANLKNIPKIKVPRMYCHDIHLATSVQLHTFTDASEEACVAVSYLRVKVGENINVSVVSAKTRVAPTKKQTIPRLELLAAELGASNAFTIQEELKVNIEKAVFWTDSKTVLLWIRSETLRYKEFVANRISRIQDKTNVADWRWVPTKENVADQGTRLHSAVELETSSSWLTGPPFLQEEPEAWPVEDKREKQSEVEEKVKTNLNSMLGDPFGISPSGCGLKGGESGVTVDIHRHSSFNKLLRAQAAVNLAISHWMNKWKKVQVKNSPWSLREQLPKMTVGEEPQKFMHRIAPFLRKNLESNLGAEDLEKAEFVLIRKVQQESFPVDMLELEQQKRSKKGKLWRLSPYLDERVIRMRGRISRSDAAEAAKNPIILPGRHAITELLIMAEHRKMAHQGIGTVHNNLRGKYWITEGRASVRRVFGKCLVCRHGKAKPIIPEMGDLPHYRLAGKQFPFTFTGVDLFGPMEAVVGRHHEKRWVCVFTCMVTRALHLEVVYGLSTDEFMMALSRFVDQRGRPHHIYSDNGTNFVGANKELKKNWEEFDWNRIKGNERFQQITWHFMPPYSPHFGGAWERMVQAVKKVLEKTLHEKFPRDQVLFTLLKGAENIVNSRPLTYVSGDAADPEALTPNHFLRGFNDVGPSIPGVYEDHDEFLRTHWRRAQLLLDIFWMRWSKEVLPELANRQKWNSEAEPLEKGDIVLLMDDQLPRNFWVKGVVKEVFPGSDGQVRVVEVLTADFKTKPRKCYKRGVDKVIPLGLKMENPVK